MRRRIRLLVGLAALLCSERVLEAQTPQSVPAVSARLSDVTRFEAWSFFEPRAGGGDPTYRLLGNRPRLAVDMRSRRVDLRGAFQYSQLLGLPRFATGPGPLGPGAAYFDASRAPRAYQLYIRAMSVRLKDPGGVAVEAGRFDSTSAADGAATSAAVERLTESAWPGG